jgi:hypothetical protein
MFNWSVKPCVTAERESSLIFVQFGVDIGCDEECDDRDLYRRRLERLNRRTQIYSTDLCGLPGQERLNVSVSQSEGMSERAIS